jgi:hypothetical protein
MFVIRTPGSLRSLERRYGLSWWWWWPKPWEWL